MSSERPSVLWQEQQASQLKCLEFSSWNIKHGKHRCPVPRCLSVSFLAKSSSCLDLVPVQLSQKDLLMIKNWCAQSVHACRLATGRNSNSELCRSLKWQSSPEVWLVRYVTARHFEITQSSPSHRQPEHSAAHEQCSERGVPSDGALWVTVNWRVSLMQPGLPCAGTGLKPLPEQDY